MTIVEMKVHMCCSACENKIRKALSKQGIDTMEIDMAMQKVTVSGYAEAKKILKCVRRTGKKAEIWPYPYNSEYHPFTAHYYRQHTNYMLAGSSTYNYYKHGYNGSSHGHYQTAPHSTIVDDRSSTMFSDENPHACSVM